MAAAGPEIAVWRLFGYGSLLFSPEMPAEVVDRFPARLPGHRRSFNKLSTTRFCPRAESHDAFPTPHERFMRGDEHRSLVLGTEPDDAAEIDGMVLVYSETASEEALRLTDAREGYDPHAPSLENGYVRADCVVVDGETGRAVECSTYLSNPEPKCVHRCPPLSLEAKARALVNATPRVRSGASDSRGIHYLEGVREELRALGVIDLEIERLAAAVRGLDGPWQELIAPLS